MTISSRILWPSLSLLIVAADQVSKLMVIDNLTYLQRIPILPILDLVHLHNTGAAFSFLADASGWQNWMFGGIAIVVSGVIFWWLIQIPAGERRVLSLGLALVLGGAIGNLIDRAMYGYVVDFILFYYHQWSYPAFNIADTAISSGVVLILFDGLVLEKRRKT